jgi:hypothetical protein
MKKMHQAMTANNREISGTVLFGALVIAVALMIGFQTPATEAPMLRQANVDLADTKLVGLVSEPG